MQNLPTGLFMVGLLVIAGSLLTFWVVAPALLNSKISQFMKLREGDVLWNKWTNITAPIYFKVYAFNITNPNEIDAGGLPKLQTVGPYVYEEKRANKVLENHLEENILVHEPSIKFHFRPDLSNGTENDVLTVLNLPLVSIANELTGWSKIMRYMAKEYIETYDEKLFVQRTVKLAFFEGVHSELVESLSGLLGREDLPNNTFGYFYERNKTLPSFKIISGHKDNSNFATILEVDGKPTLDVWEDDQCNTLKGSDGTLYKPFISKDDKFDLFILDICRSFNFVYQKEETFDNITGYRYVLPQNFWNSNIPENQCYCMEKDKNKCPLPGVLSIAPCKKGAPLLLSAPYFATGDPKYLSESGLTVPNNFDHESFILLEPKTGTNLRTTLKMQLNIQMKPSKDISELQNVRDMVFPIFWVDEDALQEGEMCELIRSEVIAAFRAIDVCKVLAPFVGLLLTVSGVLVFLLRTRSKQPLNYY